MVLFSSYQLNAHFLYSITIYMLYYNPQHVSSSTLLVFRRTNCIITASGIVTVCKRPYSMPVRIRKAKDMFLTWNYQPFFKLPGCCSILQTGHITLSSTPDQQLENHSTKYHRQQPPYNTLELLMMGIVVPETCWASNKICNKNVCCI